MLRGDYISLLSDRGKHFYSYHQAVTALQAWYNRKDKRDRILITWQGMPLLECMGRDQGESEIDVFRNFTEKMISYQEQLESSHYSENFFRDRLISFVDIPKVLAAPAIESFVPEHNLLTVWSTLSDKPRTDGGHTATFDPGRPRWKQKSHHHNQIGSI